MSDPPAASDGFLAHLVESVRLQEPYLQRRQPSLFEPVPPWSEADVHEGSRDEGAHAAPIGTRGGHGSDAPTPAIVRLGPTTAPAAVPGSASPSSPDRGGLRDTSEWNASSAPAESPARGELRVIRETLRIHSSVRIVQHVAAPAPRRMAEFVTSTAPVAAAARPGHGSNAPEAAPERRQRATRVASAQGVDSQHASGPEGEGPISARRVRAVGSTTPTAPRGPVVSPPVTPSRAALRSAAMRAPTGVAPRPAQPALPPVHVTIGRVEVRAVPPPVKAERSPRAGPRLSLEDYLRDRHGDGR